MTNNIIIQVQIRDGGHGYSNEKGISRRWKGGEEFPEEITSKSRWLWLRFKSDENIEYSGFAIVYEFIPRPTNSKSLKIDSIEHLIE
jgi:hypothetical protein